MEVTTSSASTPQYHLGNYYNWAAVIASNDASIYGAYNSQTYEYENLEVSQSIYPAGWTLPYVNQDGSTFQSEGDLVELWSEYGYTDYDGFSDIFTLWSAPLYIVPGGHYYGNYSDVGISGVLLSSVAAQFSNGVRVAGLEVGGQEGTFAYPAGQNTRNTGLSVRCRLR